MREMAKNKNERHDGLADDLLAEHKNEKPVKAKKPAKAKKPWSLRKKIIVAAACTVAAAILGVVGYYASILFDPLSGFSTIAEQTRTPAPATTTVTTQGVESTPTATPDPYDELLAQADFTKLEGIVNILLIGVDHGEERDSDSWTGKRDFHSDVMIVLSINTNTNEVSMISLPRDTYAKIPGVDGIYKLNLSLNCGGGWPSEANDYSQSGFDKVCEAASWMIGGIPIQYYYAVDFGAVKDLVDAVGGVDYDMDIAFKINGRSYVKGMQHLDGQGALDYMRVRKSKDIEDSAGQTTDLKRINRQKAMLVAIYKQMMTTGTLFRLPAILSAFDGNLYTNVDMRSTAGFAAWAYEHIDPDNIKVYSMDGKYAYYIFNFHFVLTDLDKRVEIINEVYGIDISTDSQYTNYYKQYKYYTTYYAWSLSYDMQSQVATSKSRSLLDQMQQLLEEDAQLPPYPTPTPPEPSEPSSTPTTSPDSSEAPTETPTETPTATPTATPTTSPTPLSSEGYRQYGDDVIALYNQAEAEYTALLEWDKTPSRANNAERLALLTQFKTDIQTLCGTFAITIPDATWDKFWRVIFEDARYVNQDIVANEVPVDFN